MGIEIFNDCTGLEIFLFYSTRFIVELGIEFQVEVNFFASILRTFLHCLFSDITVEESKVLLIPGSWNVYIP